MTTVKNINANGTMSNLVGLWAVIRDEHGKIKHRVFIYGKADENHFLVQAGSALSGEPNAIRIARLDQMTDWVFYDTPELLADECQREFEQGSVRFKFELDYPNGENTETEGITMGNENKKDDQTAAVAGSAPWWYEAAVAGSAQEVWEARYGLPKYHHSEGWSVMPPTYEWGWDDGRKALIELLRECLPHIEEICEAEPVGGPDDGCGVNRAMVLRDAIYAILSNA